MAFPGNSILSRLRKLPANVWSVSITSFFTDISSEMVINVLPLFLANVLGVQTALIGVIEGVAEATASLLKVFSGWLSDRIGGRKWLAVAGYGISALSKPFFYIANTWGLVAGVRWADRVGKGIRTAPRDALVADSIKPEQRGIAFGFHRAADTAGAMVGLLVAMLVIWLTQSNAQALSQHTFQIIVLVSLVPAFAGVAALALGTRDVAVKEKRAMPKFGFRSLGKPFMVFMVIVAIFDLGNSSDAFLVLRAQERGISVTDAGDVQPGLYPDIHPGGVAVRSYWPQTADRGRLAGVCGDLPGVWPGTASLAHLGIVYPLWVILWHGLWHQQGTCR
jgi:hypothetical protein